ncbi:MAG: hypothetical protein KF754_16190 [Planctomycetes bacterium]|nr:hypothetical protein [Planctomycetota bacterium]
MGRSLFAVFAIVAAFLFTARAPEFHVAQAQDPPKLTDARPFVETLKADEARALILKAGRGDAEAKSKIEEGRLAHVALIAQVLGGAGHEWRHAMLRKEIDWVRSMQKWEVILAGMHTDRIVQGFKEREATFRSAEIQLARAIIAAHNLGDFAARDQLAAQKPQSPWTAGALAWLGVTDGEPALQAMAKLVGPAVDAAMLNISLYPVWLTTKGASLRAASEPFRSAEMELSYGHEGVVELQEVPTGWGRTWLIERLGMLAGRLGGKAPSVAEEAVVKATGEPSPRNLKHLALVHAMQGEAAKTTPIPGHTSALSIGPLMVCYANMLPAEHTLGRRVAAMAAFHGTPHFPPAQRVMLRSMFASYDPLQRALAARAVLALRDGKGDGIASLVAELAASPHMADHAKAFATALEQTGHAGLKVAAANLRAGKPAALAADDLKLSDSQKAELMQPFADDNERAAYGGALGVYWLTRAVMAFGRNELYSAMEFGAKAVVVVSESNGRTLGLAVSRLVNMYMRQLLANQDLVHFRKVMAEKYPRAGEILNAELELESGKLPPGAKEADRLWYVVNDATLVSRTNLERKDVLAFTKDLPRCAGEGQVILGYYLNRTESSAARNEMWALADRTAPLDTIAITHRLPQNDWFGRYAWKNWAALERMSLRYLLLRPFHLDALGRVSSVLARAGEPPRGYAAMVGVAVNAPATPFYLGGHNNGLRYALFARGITTEYLFRTYTATGPEMSANVRSGYSGLLQGSRWGLDMEGALHRIALTGQKGHYLAACQEAELISRGTGDVDRLFNIALETCRSAPEITLQHVASAEKIGVNSYGYFVGSQSYIRSKAVLGKADEAMERYKELRDGDDGYPPYLDNYLLAGLLEGNQHAALPAAIKEIEARKNNSTGPYFTFLMRRALMASGRHTRVGKVAVPTVEVNTMDGFNGNFYSPLFHEARALLESGKSRELAARVRQHWDARQEDTPGVHLDTMLLMAVAMKISPEGGPPELVDAQGRLRFYGPEIPAGFIQCDTLLDIRAMEILAGMRDVSDLPMPGNGFEWHGERFAERVVMFRGTGLLTPGECKARDPFVRGVLAWLGNKPDDARKHLADCVKADQRCSHEYHVAEWLLATQLAKKD